MAAKTGKAKKKQRSKKSKQSQQQVAAPAVAVLALQPPPALPAPAPAAVPLLPVNSMLKSFERLRDELSFTDASQPDVSAAVAPSAPHVWVRRMQSEALPPLDGSIRLDRAFFERHTLRVSRDLVGAILVNRSAEGVTAGRIVETEAYAGPADLGAHSRAGKPTERTRAMFGPRGHAYVFLVYGAYWCFNTVSGLNGAPQAVLVRALEPLEGMDLMRERLSKPIKKDVPETTAQNPPDLTQPLAETSDAVPVESEEPAPADEAAAEQAAAHLELQAGAADVVLQAEQQPHPAELPRPKRLPARETSLCQGPGKLCRAMGITGAHYGLDLTTSDELFLVPAGLRPDERIARSPRINIDYAGEWISKPWRFYIAGHPAVSGPSKLRK